MRPKSRRIAFYGVDDLASGRIMGEQAIALLNGKGKVAVISSLGATNLQNRLNGVKEALAKAPGIQIVETYDIQEDVIRCAEIIATGSRRYPDLAAWISVGGWPVFTRNALAAVDSSKTKVISFDTISPALDLLREGKVQVLLGQKYFGWGSESVRLLRDHQEGPAAGVGDYRFRRGRSDARERRRVRTTMEKNGGATAMKISRSEFFQLVAGGSAWLVSSGFAQKIALAVPDRARPLPLNAVRLTGGPLKHAQDLDAAYLLALDPDRMLAFYRKRASLPQKAEGYAGWDADGRQLTGHIAGHHLSAVSLMWAATGDARFKQRADYIVSELKVVQDANRDGFAGALPGVKEAFADVSKGKIRAANFDLNGLWSPWYTLHKTFAGLRDAYRHTGNQTALDVEVKFAQWAATYLDPMDDATVQRMLATEFGGMNEMMADLYADTGDKRWLDLSYKFEHKAVLDPLKRGDDPLSSLHGNTQVPKLVGSAARYAYAGDKADLAAATVFWDRVVNHHTFATGGHGKDEYFREPDKLGNITEGRTAETCNVYNMLKLTRKLFALQPDIRYAEFHERALFNHILGSIDAQDGATCYMVPVGSGVRREYADMQRSFTCCVGTGMESHALHGLGLYYEDGNRLWVNVYAPSTAQWEAAGVKLSMETSFPEGETAALTLDLRAPKSFTIALRRPSWVGKGFEVRVNDKTVAQRLQTGSYVEITRTWNAGDEISLVLPKTASSRTAWPTTPKKAVVMWGPLVLAGDLGAAPRRRDDGDGDGVRAAAPEPVALVTTRPVNEWLTPVAGKPGTYRAFGCGPNHLHANPD